IQSQTLVPPLPWTPVDSEDSRFRRILLRVAAILLLLSLIMPFLPVADIVRPPPEEPPKRYVQLLLQPQPVAPPVDIRAETAKTPEVAQVPAPQPQPAPAPAPRPESAREQAQRSGVLAMRNSLESLHDDPSVGKLREGRLSTSGGTAERTERSILTSKVAQGSGGINTSNLSRDTGGGVQLGGRATRIVSSPIGDIGPAGGGAGQRNKKASRTDEEIQLVFDRNKSSIFGIYNRALRENAALQGRMVLRLTIAPSGEVTNIGVVSSELGDSELERRLLARIKAFNFGEKDVDTVTVTYPIHFFPS
ncbi:MAG TPA: AgmX/PglI C-terminal domain-containing protein, partial [Gammaproteobacteria bacterium]|nr:AgmX/PglI C-terminal domain-containing protein [Gammaproteobacteria bacterium]